MIIDLQPVGGLVHRGVLDEASVLLVEQRDVGAGVEESSLEAFTAIVGDPQASRAVQDRDLRVLGQLRGSVSRNEFAKQMLVAKDGVHEGVGPLFGVVDLDQLDAGFLRLGDDAGKVALAALNNSIVIALLDAGFQDLDELRAVVLRVEHGDFHVVVLLGVSNVGFLQPCAVHVAQADEDSNLLLRAGGSGVVSRGVVRGGGCVVAGGGAVLLGAADEEADQHEGCKNQCEYLFHVSFSFLLFTPALRRGNLQVWMDDGWGKA